MRSAYPRNLRVELQILLSLIYTTPDTMIFGATARGAKIKPILKGTRGMQSCCQVFPNGTELTS